MDENVHIYDYSIISHINLLTDYNYSVVTTVCKKISPLGTLHCREIKSLSIHNKFTDQTFRYASYKNIGS